MVYVDELKQSWVFFLFFARTLLIMVVLFASWGECEAGSRFFKHSEWGKVRYLVMLKLMPLPAHSLVKMAVAGSIVG